MGNIEDHGIPDYVQRVIDNNNRMMNPAPFSGPGYPYRRPDHNSDREILESFLKRENEKINRRFLEGWSRWETLGDKQFQNINSIVNRDGRLEVFGISPDRTLWNCWQQDRPNGNWHDWCQLGDNWKVSNVIPARNEDGRLEIFVLGEDKAVYNKWQKWPGGEFSGWNYLGGQLKSGVSVGYSIDGRMELFALGINNDIQHRWQTAPNNGWSDWGSQGGYLLGSVSVERNRSEGLEIFGIGQDYAVYHKWQWGSGSGWSDWNCLGGHLIGNVSACRHPNDKRLEIFGIGQDHNMWHKWQESPTYCNWSEWHNFGNIERTGLNVYSNKEGLSVYSFFPYGDKIWRRVFNPHGWSDWYMLSTQTVKSYTREIIENGKEALFVINGQNQVQYSRQI